MSEWLCARIAHALSLPVPECFISKIEPEKFRAWRACQTGDCPSLVTDTNPYVFCSRHVDAAKDVITPELDLKGLDAGQLAKIFAFDLIIRNTDRTESNSNLLVNHGIHVIDHNNAFSRMFELQQFSKEHVLRNFCGRELPTDIDGFRNEFRSTITSSFLDNVWSEMPTAWTDVGEEVFSLEEVKNILLGDCR